MVSSLGSTLHTEECLLIFVSVGVVTVNKYVLSNLHFTIPTVFQGWQTLVCVLLLSVLMKWSRFRMEIQIIDRITLWRLLFPLVCFSLSNVAGSKALADLPVAVFLTGTNLVPAALTLLNRGKSSAGILGITGYLTLCGSILALYMLDSGHNSAWLWLAVHVIAQSAQIYTLTKLHLSSISAMYYCNFSSVIILLPLSIYLQEASSALHHAQNANSEFFLGCLLSGILGTALQLLSATLQDNSCMPLYQGVSKIFACSISLVVSFPNDINPVSWLLILVVLVTGCFVFSFEGKGGEQKPSGDVAVI